MNHATPRRIALVSLIGLGVIGAIAIGRPGSASGAEGRTLHVPADFARAEDAIAASNPGDVILLAPGTYPGDLEIPQDKPGITIRGVDRNTVVFDGSDVRHNAIDVSADGVTLENMTAHSYTENGFYWDGVDGYAGRYLTVWNVGLYGIYAIESQDGVIEQSYVSGAADAAFYIGECNPCDAAVRNVTATLSAVGYSGTNAGGNLIVEDSRFTSNGVGILPNSFEVGLEPPPQRDATFRRNVVTGSGRVPTPRSTPLGGFHGIGIGIAGGVGNLVEDNVVEDSSRYGVAVFTAVDFAATWVPAGNRIVGNRIETSGTADLALAAGSGAGNCFERNVAAVALPADLGAACSSAGAGDSAVAAELVLPPPAMLEGLPAAPPYSTMPAPGAQPTMPVGGDTPAPELVVPWLAAGAAAVIVVGILAALLIRRRRAGGATSP